ncbi:MAG TPA: hypothetical protein VE644_14200 [Gaiellaceae bacterium]|nr:hypothetical protein [Gaiellaceae bacterium]
MATYPVVEHRESRMGRWVRPRRLRIALFVGLVETLLVLLNGLGWFWVLGAAVLGVGFHFFVGRRAQFHSVREISWIVAVSQLIAVVVPLLWELVKFLAITVLVVLALVLLVMLLVDRRQ